MVLFFIDNIFINDISCQSTGGNVTSSISDHFFQFSVTDILQKLDNKREVKYTRDFRKFNKREFGEELSKIDWSDIIDESNGTEACYQFFYDKIEILLDEMAPFRQMTKKEIRLEQRPWITQGLLVSMRVRDSLYKQRTQEKNIEAKNKISELYKRYRNLIVLLLKRVSRIIIHCFLSNTKAMLKKTWDGIRNLINVSKKKSLPPSKLVYKNKDKCSNIDMAESFNDFFVNIGTSVESKIPQSNKNFSSYLKQYNNKSIFLNACTDFEIQLVIGSLKSSKACGPNSIPTNILLEFSELLVTPLVSIINMSFKEGVFPSLNKKAIICPIYKKGDKKSCENYRPISLLSNMSKIFERLMYNRLENFLNTSDIIYKFQFGFRKRYSTTHALLSIVEEIRNSLDNRMFSCGVFIDLEKAFDTVNHKILLSKLDHYGIRGVANEWFSSYLSNRTQSVCVNGVSSSPLPITCGVPQGSILGPLLFLLYINDMNLAVESSKIFHFADDTNLLCSSRNLKTLKQNMNKDLKLLYDWLCANRLSLNVKKTEFIVFRPPRYKQGVRITLNLHHTQLFESSKLKYLGVILDNKLNWKAHIAELSKKLSRAVGLLYKIGNFCPPSILRTLYNSLFVSHLSYGLAVWGNADQVDIRKIKYLQKRAIKIIGFYLGKEYNNHLYFDLKTLKFDDQLQLQLASLMWDYDHNRLPSSLSKYFKRSNIIHNYKTRSATKGNLYNSKFNTVKFGFKSFKHQGILILNKV